jgi:hypothetical protein
MPKKFVVKKFDGDDQYSYAVFEAKDVKGIKGVVMYGEATPIVCGCTRQQALSHKRDIENRG